MLRAPSLGQHAAIADTLQRPRSPLTRRELVAEGLVGGGFALAVALLWLLAPPHAFAVAPAITCVLVLVVALRVRIDTPFGCTVPTQLAFVPLLFVLPPALVPVAVVAAALIARLAEVLTGAVQPSRMLQAVSNSWFAIGPAAVFVLARTPTDKAGAALLLGALGAQFVVDFAVSAARFALARGASLIAQLGEYWVYVVDAALSGTALLAAENIHRTILAALAPLPLLGLVALFARERHQRLENLVELNDGLQHQAFYDALTGLPNRVLAIDRAEQMIARGRRNALPGAALYIDLDGFKQVNDGYGHAAGDELLRLVAARLSSAIREGDTAARLAGDEFLVLLEGSALDAGPEFAAARLMELLCRPHEINAETGRQLTVTASIGIAMGERGTADELLRDADVAMYEAKRAGKNRYVIFESGMQTAARNRLTVQMDLADALESDEMFLLYQPIVDLRSERPIGVEALIRWRHPTRGIVPPVEFVPIAEASGLIVPLGRWVLDEACRQAAEWHAAGHALGISVNVSGRQLDGDELIDDVRHALVSSGLDPRYLTLEVTETTLMRNADAAAERLVSLTQLGVRIAIDDFGTGYSSLAYLSQFPVDLLKIDQSFIRSAASSSESAALVHTLVALGKTLHIQTLAEGIEEPAHLRALQREQCDLGQGYLFARPLAADAVEEFLDLAGPAGADGTTMLGHLAEAEVSAGGRDAAQTREVAAARG
jgi:diguanylate cyclase (GGDEF)-like protein